ncbi:PREDICTED: T-complex protein 10A homolog 2-like, partial [Galeopterus variegatus]|uniref:T-complex protein 10A homolog 2-like n=1 Tax=Galeopterus variegatus TaxID=482537 RepID=A0ABM0SJP9_GALVR
MLTGHLEAGEAAEPSHAEGWCPGAGADPEKTATAAGVPRKDSGAREMVDHLSDARTLAPAFDFLFGGATRPETPLDHMKDPVEKLRLQQQVSRLQEEFRRHVSRWADAHSKLQSQIDILMKQNLELREELRASELQRLEAREKSAAFLPTRRGADTLVSISESAFGKISPLPADKEIKPKYVGSKSRSATLPGQGSPSKNLTSPKPVSFKIERTDSEKTISQEDRDETPSRGRRDSRTAPSGRSHPSEGLAVSEGEKVILQPSRTLQEPSGRPFLALASDVAVLQEDKPEATEN